MNPEFYEQLSRIVPQERILQKEPMKKHTTFQIGGSADLYICPDFEQLKEALVLAAREEVPVTVIGNGSNLLVDDNGIRGLVIEIGRGMDEVRIEGNRMRAGAGALLSKAANDAAAAGLSGLEFAAGIPGTVGGALVMNAGAYGGEMKDIVVQAEGLTADGKLRTLAGEELDLSYRHSCIPEKGYIVASAEFQLTEKDPAVIRETMAGLRRKRAQKQPLEYPSAGSTFKRPEGYFAGKLIMDAGLAGRRVGDAQVSPKHCGFVVNLGNASAADVKNLIAEVERSVYEKFGVKLEPEIKMIGG